MVSDTAYLYTRASQLHSLIIKDPTDEPISATWRLCVMGTSLEFTFRATVTERDMTLTRKPRYLPLSRLHYTIVSILQRYLYKYQDQWRNISQENN